MLEQVVGGVVGVGVDVADVGRFERLVSTPGGRTWAHWYTKAETEECLRSPRPGVAAALRFAVKEATYKAVGAHFGGPVRWADIEVLGGEPAWRVEMRGEVAAAASAADIRQLHASTCRMPGRVMAVVLAEAAARQSHLY